MNATPTPPAAALGLPMAVWTYLPLFVCMVFAVAILIGFLFITRENRRIAAQQRINDENSQNQND